MMLKISNKKNNLKILDPVIYSKKKSCCNFSGISIFSPFTFFPGAISPQHKQKSVLDLCPGIFGGAVGDLLRMLKYDPIHAGRKNTNLHPRKLTAGPWKCPLGKGKTATQTIILWVPAVSFRRWNSNLRNFLKLKHISEIQSKNKKNIPIYQTQEHVLRVAMVVSIILAQGWKTCFFLEQCVWMS